MAGLNTEEGAMLFYPLYASAKEIEVIRDGIRLEAAQYQEALALLKELQTQLKNAERNKLKVEEALDNAEQQLQSQDTDSGH